MGHASFATYRPSGRFSPLTLPLFIAAIVSGVAVAWLYQALMSWIPYIYVDLVLCAGFGAALGAAGMFAVRRGHCRNRVLAAILALPLALAPVGASYYWGYRSTLSTIAEQHPETPLEIIQQELTFSRWLEVKQEAGWTLSSHGSSSSRSRPDVSGTFVVVVWVIEALVILGLTMLLVDTEAAKPYCESCRGWCVPRPLTPHGLTAADVESAMQMGDLGPLIDPPVRAEGDPLRAIVLTGDICDGCIETGFLSVDERTTVQRKKQTTTRTKNLLRRAVLTAPQRAAFLHRYTMSVGQKLAA
ncbi:MAG: hypothetical protein JWN44_31 [Myxococcales bacterium]|nr:hypothetical protein [Myxococcales bacterium]